MNRDALIEHLITHPDIRVWQAIRNYSSYAFIYGATSPAPIRSDYPDAHSYAAACVVFAEGLQDTFHLPDDEPTPIAPLPATDASDAPVEAFKQGYIRGGIEAMKEGNENR